MSNFEIAGLGDVERRLVGRFTIRIIADLKRCVERGEVLTVNRLQEIENDLLAKITSQWVETTGPSRVRVEEWKR